MKGFESFVPGHLHSVLESFHYPNVRAESSSLILDGNGSVSIFARQLVITTTTTSPPSTTSSFASPSPTTVSSTYTSSAYTSSPPQMYEDVPELPYGKYINQLNVDYCSNLLSEYALDLWVKM